MNDHDDPVDPVSQAISSARATEQAIQQLCRTTLTRPSMAPAEVDIVLAHLADAATALPQAASQLGDILAQSKEDRVLEMDNLTEIEDPDVAIDTARVHLDGVRDAALDVYRLLNAARNETAHIAVAGPPHGGNRRHHAGHSESSASGEPATTDGRGRWTRPGPRVVTSEVGER